jgi:chemotaxis protein methyltransferase CheR
MNDRDCIEFLQWALPRLGLRWRGFRRVRRQVCRRIAGRVQQLGLGSLRDYGERLERLPAEWLVLDGLCHITISRFYRDRAVFDMIRDEVLPSLADAVAGDDAQCIRCWSAGCASGEEPYTLALLWHFALAPAYPHTGLDVLATDVEPSVLARARRACYPSSSLRELPDEWRSGGFERHGVLECLRPALRKDVRFRLEDVRAADPPEPFQLVLCRNLAFTYFEPGMQRATLASIRRSLSPNGALIIGVHESLPEESGFERWGANQPIYRRTAD